MAEGMRNIHWRPREALLKPEAAVHFSCWKSLPPRACLALIIMLAATPVLRAAELQPDAVNSAEPSRKPLSSEKPTPIGIRLQVLLDRAHFSPGEIDGKFGENAKKALRAYAEAQQLPSADSLTEDVWKRLTADPRAALTHYTTVEKDVAGPFLKNVPSRLEGMKDIPKLNYASPREALAEKFHMSEELLGALNPGQHFDRAGATIVVVDTSEEHSAAPAKADRVEVDKSRQTVKLFDRSNSLIGFYPATVGSEEKPSPTGSLKVTEIDHNPTYRYNPDYHFKGVHSRKPFEIRPGPNNPVGTVWINLSANGYGIHGTPSPGKVSKAASHGCVRLTNWDAERVAAQVSKGTAVNFVDAPRS
jgi:lipoprotein-anchoring transpeptidase ErfK/SrfK